MRNSAPVIKIRTAARIIQAEITCHEDFIPTSDDSSTTEGWRDHVAGAYFEIKEKLIQILGTMPLSEGL
jgi:hypothetical protein